MSCVRGDISSAQLIVAAGSSVGLPQLHKRPGVWRAHAVQLGLHVDPFERAW